MIEGGCCSKVEKTLEDARIIYHEHVAGQVFRLGLHSPQISGKARAGQFIMLRIGNGVDPLLRRPFSFSRIFPGEGIFEILYRITGRGTWALSRLSPGSSLSVAGPLGNGFLLPRDPSCPTAFIAGGIGIAPLPELIGRALAASTHPADMHLFYGARTASEILPESAVRALGIPVHFASDDGTFGFKGPVTLLLQEFYAQAGLLPGCIYSCGPLAMQYHVAKWALANNVSSQLSLESLMACGIGACLGCALPASGPGSSQLERFVHVCEDGPVFSAGSIKWNQILAQQSSPPTYQFS